MDFLTQNQSYIDWADYHILTSSLFIGQTRTIISSFPILREIVESTANWDNSYPNEKKWKIVEIK